MPAHSHDAHRGRTLARDTSPWAEALLVDRWRDMATWEKAALVSELSKSVARSSEAGVRARFPELSDAEVRFKVIELRLGQEIMEKFGIAWTGRSS